MATTDQAATIDSRLRAVEARYNDIEAKLAEMGAAYDARLAKELSKERASLEPTVSGYHRYQQLNTELASAESLLRESDPELAEMARTEVQRLRTQVAAS